jgi:WD40 repeat protein/serine/threonine protein kinase
MSWSDRFRQLTSETARHGASALRRNLPVDSQVGKLIRRFVPADEDPISEANAAERFDPYPLGAPPRGSGWPPPPRIGERLRTAAPLPRPQRYAATPAPPPARGDGAAADRGNTALAMLPRALSHPASLPGEAPQLAAGQRVAEHYEVVRALAATPQFDSYAARQTLWGIDVLLKIPALSILRDGDVAHELVDAVERWTSLGLHPHIAYCYGLEAVADFPVLVVELATGGTLQSWIADGRTLNPRLGLNLAIQACHALEYLHLNHLLHGSPSPQNFLVSGDGMLLLTDVGLPRPHNPDGARGRGERSTDVYVAPEQWVDATDVDTRADLFAFGVCLYEALCGQRPYGVARGPRREPPKAKLAGCDRLLPEPLAGILERCVDWERERRPSSAAEIRAALCCAYEEIVGRPSPFAELPDGTWEADGWNNRAMKELAAGRAEEADAAWGNALSGNSQHLQSTYNRGVVLWRRGELSDDALVQQLERIRAVQRDAAADYYLGLVHLERGDADAALPLLERVACHHPQTAAVERSLQLARAARAGASGRIFSGHRGFVSAVCLNADGDRLLSASDDGTLCLWDVRSARMLRSLEGHTERVSAACMNADGSVALSGSDDFSLRLWEVRTGRCLRVLPTAGGVFSVAINADGSRAVSASSSSDNFLGIDNTEIRVWDLDRERRLALLEGHTNAAKSIAISADGRWIASGSDDQTVRVWDATGGACRRVLEGHDHYVSCVAISPDGARVLSGSWDQTVRLWDANSGRCTQIFRGSRAIVTAVALSADQRFAVSGSWDGSVRIWELESGRCLRTFFGHTRMVTGVALSADARIAASGSWDQTVRSWSVPIDPPQVCDPRPTTRFAYASLPSPEPDAEERISLAERALARDRQAEAFQHLQRVREAGGFETSHAATRLWRRLAQTHRRLRPRALQRYASWSVPERVTAVLPLADAGRVLCGGRDGRLRVWDVDLERWAANLESDGDPIPAVVADPATGLAATANGCAVDLWDLSASRRVQRLAGHTGLVRALHLGAAGKRVLSASYDHTLRWWDFQRGECLAVLRGHTRQVTAAACDAAGRWAVSGAHDGSVWLWNLERGDGIAATDKHRGAVLYAYIDSHRGRAITAGRDGQLRVWEPDGKLCGEGRALENDLASFALAPDGTWACAAGADGRLQLWDLDGAEHALLAQRGGAPLCAAALAADATWLAVADTHNTVEVWEIDWDLAPPEDEAGARAEEKERHAGKG